jgi:hypothetical protein
MDAETIAARRALSVATFARLKTLVRELEDSEKLIGENFGPAEIDFKLNPNEVAWYVAYRTNAERVGPLERAAISQKK